MIEKLVLRCKGRLLSGVLDAKDSGTQSIVGMGILSSRNLASLFGITYTCYSNVVGVVALVGW